MPEYTEQQIRELSGRELRVAVHRLVLGDEVGACLYCCGVKSIKTWRGEPSQGYDWYPCDGCGGSGVAEPLEMPLDWCVPKLMQLDWKLERLDKHWCVTVPDETAIPLPGLDRAVAVGWSDSLDDPATAIQRAACIVALREGGD